MTQFTNTPLERDQHIEELVGLAPYYGDLAPRDGKPYVASWEICDLIDGVQRGDDESAKKLIASRLVWVYETFAQNETVASRYDLELTDVMQIGCLAVIEAAKKINLDGATPANAHLLTVVDNEAKKQIAQTRLIPSIEANTFQPTSMSRGDNFQFTGRETALPVDDKRLSAYRKRYENSNPDSIENTVFRSLAVQRAILREYLAKIKPRHQYVVFQHIFAGKIFDDIGVDLGVSHARPHQILQKALKRMRSYNNKSDRVLKSLLDDDQTNMGLID